MNFRQLVAISGLPGLYQLMATKSDGAIVKSIEDGSTRFVGARAHSVSSLDGIEVYTETDNIRLLEVFMIMKGNAESAGEFDSSKADNNAIKAHFGKLFPEYDKERVYVSDMKKMMKWFYILHAKDLLKTEEELAAAEAPTEAKSEDAAAPAEVAKEKPAKKTTKKESAPADTETTASEEKPKKPRAKKAKDDESAAAQ
jgi:hypothetical protein